MNDKDKSFFAKIILASVIFFAFLTVLGLTAELVKNKKAVNSQPQISASPEPTVSVKDETADWQTYRNEEYGFELEYPQNWNEKESPDNDIGILLLNTNKEIVMGGVAPDDYFSSDYKEINPKYTDDWIGIQIDTYPKPVNFSWDSWIKFNFPVVEEYDNFNYKELRGIKITKLNGLFYGEPNIFIEDEKLYNIRLFNEYPYNINLDTKREDLGLVYFNQILSTFKFTN